MANESKKISEFPDVSSFIDAQGMLLLGNAYYDANITGTIQSNELISKYLDDGIDPYTDHAGLTEYITNHADVIGTAAVNAAIHDASSLDEYKDDGYFVVYYDQSIYRAECRYYIKSYLDNNLSGIIHGIYYGMPHAEVSAHTMLLVAECFNEPETCYISLEDIVNYVRDSL